MGQVREEQKEKYEELEVEEEVYKEEVEEEEKESSALTEVSTSLGAARIPTLGTAASPKKSSSPGRKSHDRHQGT